MSDHFFKTRKETKAWLDKMHVGDYTIHDDLTVDVFGSIDISNKNLTHIPVQFGEVTGMFFCHKNMLTSLAGSPRICESFYSNNNRLINLTGAPQKCRNFICGNNQLVSLKGGPKECAVFYCDNNQLTSLDGAPEICEQFDCTNNPDLFDISAVCDGCKLYCETDVVAKNQADRHLADLETLDGKLVLSAKPGRTL